MRARLTGLLAVATALLTACAGSISGSAASTAPGITARRVVGGLDQPVAFTFGPDGLLWYVEKSTGEVRTHDLATGHDALFYDVAGVNGEGERGMLGVTLNPAFPTKPFVYVYATRSVQGHLRNQILRITDDGGKGTAPRAIFSAPASSSPYHNGGRILFGPDDKLYAIVGDGHASANAQDLSGNDRGKILRMTPSGAIPATNPRDARWFAYGVRNSFGFAFDPRTDRLWETENGPECNDEVNRIRAGGNYGWGPSETCSGTSPGNTNQDGPNPILPSLWFRDTIGITGLAFCDGCGLRSKDEGRAFFGAVNDGRIRWAELSPDRNRIVHSGVLLTHDGGVLSMEVGPDGTMYFSDFEAIYRLVRA